MAIDYYYNETELVLALEDTENHLFYQFYIDDQNKMFFQTLNSAEQVIEKNRYFPEFLKNYKFIWVEDGEIKNKVITIHVRLENPDQVTYSIWKSHNLSEWVQLTNEEVKAFYKRQGD